MLKRGLHPQQVFLTESIPISQKRYTQQNFKSFKYTFSLQFCMNFNTALFQNTSSKSQTIFLRQRRPQLRSDDDNRKVEFQRKNPRKRYVPIYPNANPLKPPPLHKVQHYLHLVLILQDFKNGQVNLINKNHFRSLASLPALPVQGPNCSDEEDQDFYKHG